MVKPQATSHKSILTSCSRGMLRGTFLYAVCSFILPTANANLIDATYGVGAGSFELGNFVNGGADGASFGGADFMGLAVGSTAIIGWTVGGPGDGVDWLTTPRFGALDGVHSVDLNHTIASSISTTIPTITGDVYDLSFGAAAWVSGTSNTGLVSAGSLLNQNFSTTLSNTLAAQAFDPFVFQFTATGSSTTITFKSTNQLAGGFTYGPVIDNVSVNFVSGPVTSVPEPSSIALILMGLGAEISRKALKHRKDS
ncbi:MAG: DUF642 domain-containing protein [Methylococcaceae bacterium]|nr:DUF642 domain-containing protein [Methylococcaceae bacterium]